MIKSLIIIIAFVGFKVKISLTANLIILEYVGVDYKLEWKYKLLDKKGNLIYLISPQEKILSTAMYTEDKGRWTVKDSSNFIKYIYDCEYLGIKSKKVVSQKDYAIKDFTNSSLVTISIRGDLEKVKTYVEERFLPFLKMIYIPEKRTKGYDYMLKQYSIIDDKKITIFEIEDIFESEVDEDFYFRLIKNND